MILRRQGFELPLGKLFSAMGKIVLLTAVSGGVIYLLGFARCDISESWLLQLLRLAGAGVLFVAIYFAGAKLLKLQELSELINTLRSRKRSAAQ